MLGKGSRPDEAHLVDLVKTDMHIWQLACGHRRSGSTIADRPRLLPDSQIRAEWQSGYAAACKAVYAGSIPTSASNKLSRCQLVAERLLTTGIASIFLWNPARGQCDG